MFNHLNISASAMTAQRLRMDVVSSNIANASSTRGNFVDGEWVPYRRKMVVMEPRENGGFQSVLQSAMNQRGTGQSDLNGVRVSGIVEDETPFNTMYDPTHPDADEQGYVQTPNVDLSKEMVDMLAASRSYEANVTSFNAGKSMMMKALEIGR